MEPEIWIVTKSWFDAQTGLIEAEDWCYFTKEELANDWCRDRSNDRVSYSYRKFELDIPCGDQWM